MACASNRRQPTTPTQPNEQSGKSSVCSLDDTANAALPTLFAKTRMCHTKDNQKPALSLEKELCPYCIVYVLQAGFSVQQHGEHIQFRTKRQGGAPTYPTSEILPLFKVEGIFRPNLLFLDFLASIDESWAAMSSFPPSIAADKSPMRGMGPSNLRRRTDGLASTFAEGVPSGVSKAVSCRKTRGQKAASLDRFELNSGRAST